MKVQIQIKVNKKIRLEHAKSSKFMYGDKCPQNPQNLSELQL